ncbi:hypothetical protein LPW11_03235 [Geomonas sp. RF6]|uniref:hypothetical protein n=1 Tax=Geomonas sp. RF6 TaxID=2897342 RepID=UPI001E482A96|nr:hypothetical protein [Geomonas sp. RF6]UFS71212.1 hypothetical protein LPW11_03235 [Geomonas sp. RF6]
MGENRTCCDPARHDQHICALHNKGKYEEVESLTDNPTVTCSVCLVNANSADNVCSPATIGGGFKYSDMYQRKQMVVEGDTLQEAGKKEEENQ